MYLHWSCGECPALGVICLEFSIAGCIGQSVHLSGKSNQVELICIFNYRNNEATLGRAVAIPILISFFTMIRSPSREQLIKGNFLIHFTIASIKIGVNVDLSPLSFSQNPFFTFSRHCTRLVTSASVKLVTCGPVCLLRTI